MKKEELDQILKEHEKWLTSNYKEGKRADLSGVNLSGANLFGADLSRADLSRADLSRTNLPSGETFEQYNEVVIKELCTVTGKSLEDVAKHWDCHNWDNCPMAFVFDVKSENNIPLLYKPRVMEFIQYFDAKLLPKPVVEK
jgi:hypothetical protein